MANTGRKIFTTIRQYVNGVWNGNEKFNSTDDPDYQYPVYDEAECLPAPPVPVLYQHLAQYQHLVQYLFQYQQLWKLIQCQIQRQLQLLRRTVIPTPAPVPNPTPHHNQHRHPLLPQYQRLSLLLLQTSMWF